MKCQRCGNDRIIQERTVMAETSGEEAVEILILNGRSGILNANVCHKCGDMLRKLGWTQVDK